MPPSWSWPCVNNGDTSSQVGVYGIPMYTQYSIQIGDGIFSGFTAYRWAGECTLWNGSSTPWFAVLQCGPEVDGIRTILQKQSSPTYSCRLSSFLNLVGQQRQAGDMPLEYRLFFKAGLDCLRFVWKGLPEWLSEEKLTTQGQSSSWPATASKALILYAFSRFLKHILWHIDLSPHCRPLCWQPTQPPPQLPAVGHMAGKHE